MSTLEVSGISKRFGGLQAVDKVSFAVDRGEVLGLIGPNGSGKSTAMSMIMGVVQPDSGSVKLEGQELAGQRPHIIAAAGMAMMFQHSRPLHRQTVLENIQLALLPNSVFQFTVGKEVTERAIAVAERVGMGSVLQLYPDSLPFADLRRLELAKALARDPTVLLIDEPFAGLAPSETREFSDLVIAAREAGCAIVLVDHNVKAVAGLVDRISVMNAGAKIAEGAPAEVIHDKKVREVYFGKSLDEAEIAARPQQEATAAELLSVDIQSVHYGQALALQDIQLRLGQGEFVSVVGLNGAGKTTLMNAILGFVGYQGQIAFDGRSLDRVKPSTIANSGIALCPETRELFSFMSVQENLEMGGHALSNAERQQRLEWVFELFPRLKERTRQVARTLSGGEQQMLTIGRALMQKPRLLLLDEPTLGLAPLILEDISDVLYKLQSETELSVLLTEQNLTFALKHSDRIYHLETGHLRWNGPPDRFFDEVGADVL